MQRQKSFGEDYQPTAVDRFGVWLSARQLRRHVPSFRSKQIADLGCGYDATFARTVLDEVAGATLVDVSLAADLKAHSKVTAIESSLPDALPGLPAEGFDVVMIVSVLEHLWDPLEALKQIRRMLRPGGTCLVNVPSWRGKRYLELAAFRLGVAPAAEMDDHKAYYDVSDLWPLLVRAGFLPSEIDCFSHKFGLNTFAVCRRKA
ncbi:MAG TPA: methyltransferase domain-containing protein [Polyangiaceae bacterium]